ncbi:MAG: hypothetical protein HYV14_00940 [Elusimicrobia bacterium]|nr:hypothetical protein [Elusimicrobiota bacterium]
MVEVKGETEVVYFHRNFSDDKGLAPFKPKPSNYKLDDFARLELMELMVIPKRAPGGLRSLAELRAAKDKESAKAGAEYRMVDETNEYAWPRGTFHARTTRPYRAVQTYTESQHEFFILTTGGILNEGDFGLSAKRAEDYNYTLDRALESLRKHVISGSHPSQEDSSSGNLFIPAGELSPHFFSSFKAFRFVMLFGILGGALTGLAFWPGTSVRARRTRYFGRSLFVFAHLAALAGFISVYLPIAITGVKWRVSNDATLLPVMLVPLISAFAARRLGSARAGRVLVATGAIAVLWALLTILTRGPGDRLPAEFGVFGNTVILYFLGLAFGTAFALFIDHSLDTGESR